MRFARFIATCAIAAVPFSYALAAPITLTKLTGLAGTADPSFAFTAVFKANLGGIGAEILSITIADSGTTTGGSGGQFTGFDLDAIKLSTTDCATAACAAGATGLNVFDFLSGVVFTPGTQRSPVDPKLFGTGSTGATVDNLIATLSAFDAVSSTTSPFGFVSIGDGGIISFNLTSPVSTTGLFLYVGEVGDNGETAASSITVGSNRVPEPGTLALLGIGIAGLAAPRRRKR